jgi:hypothetical protein
MQTTDGTPEAWMERNIDAALLGAGEMKKLAEEAGDHWRRVASLVVQMSEAVAKGADTCSATAVTADRTRQAVVGVAAEWSDSIRPRLRHLGRLAGGGLAAGMVLLPFCPAEVTVGPKAAERAARDLPPEAKYTVLAELSRDRGDGDAARWFEHKARKARPH